MNRTGGCRYVPGVVSKELWCYEARRCGAVPLALPVVVAALSGVLMSWSGFWARWSLGAGFALVVGLCSAAVAAGERMVEMQLTLPTVLTRTMCRRFGLLLAPALLSVALVVLFSAGELAPVALQAVACAALLAAIGGWAAITLRSLAGASTLVICGWLAKLFVVERLSTDPISQAVVVALLAVPLCTLAMQRLSDGEHLIVAEWE